MAHPDGRAGPGNPKDFDDVATPRRPAAPSFGLAVGTVVGGHYAITGPGIPGGMGIVYPVTHRELDEPQALKILHPHLVARPEAVEWFREEARLSRRLLHPGVVRVFEFGDWGGQKYLSMEWVAGGSLRHDLAARRQEAGAAKVRLPLAEALLVIRQMAEALLYAHAQGVIHRDLKPENILLQDGRPKLTDFGIARLLGREDRFASAHKLGTVGYLAPEQIEKEAQEVDHRADLFSLGVILYELACGDLPSGFFRFPHERDPRLPPALDAFLKRCLAQEPGDRFPGAAELLIGLQRLEEAIATGEARRRAAEDAERQREAEAERRREAEARAAEERERRAREEAERQRRGPAPGTVERRGKDNAEMVFIPAGTFTMGDTHGDGFDDEKPTHQVTVQAFWLDRTPLTNALFARFCKEAGYKAQGDWQGAARGKDQHPVVHVTWHDAVAYCKWAGKRLPTEAEWEYAARGTDGRKYPWGNTWEPDRARHWGNRGSETTAPVGSYPSGASPFGVLDLSGNVWEWVSSLYKPYPYVASDGREDSSSSERRVVRGGSWSSGPGFLRSADRGRVGPAGRGDGLGFRCAQGVQ